MKKIIAANPKAKHDYHLDETFEAGVVLNGSEVKSIKSKGASIKESFARVSNEEVYIHNMNITPFGPGVSSGYDPKRTRKLLLHKREINKLTVKIHEKGFTLIPLNVHLSKGLVKMDIALGKGKKLYDKRKTLQEKQVKREIDRALKDRSR